MGVKVKTRMAPSPTGEYHIGHIRTLLYNVAFARKNRGKFLIRIEDTDRERYVEGAADRILDVIEDYGFKWDEGPRVGGDFGPYVQSERLEIYKGYAKELIDRGNAYYCFCSPERLDELREGQKKAGRPSTKYDRYCLGLSRDEVKTRLEGSDSFVIRLKIPEGRDISFKDEVYGQVTVNSNDLDDQILIKSDGYPLYHLAVVVDDHLMGVTHVMRGNDWLPSTPKHILLYEALGWQIPVYVHLPNLKEESESKKLSKRFGSIFAVDFLREGYLPEAVINFLMLLGWNPGIEKELYSFEEFVKNFSIDRIHKTDLVSFDRNKLLWFNGSYIRGMGVNELWGRIGKWAEKFDIKLNSLDREDGYNLKVLSLVMERMKRLSEFNSLTHYFYEDPNVKNGDLIKYTKDGKNAKDILTSFKKVLTQIDNSDWKVGLLEDRLSEALKEKGYKTREAYMTLRVCITGESATPPIFETLELIGKEVVMGRIKIALSVIDG